MSSQSDSAELMNCRIAPVGISAKEKKSMSEQSEKSPKRLYYARVEYRKVQSEVEALHEEGHSLKVIYEQLSEAERLTMAYKTFCDYVRGGGKRYHPKKKTPAKKPQKMQPAAKDEPFRIERLPLSELV